MEGPGVGARESRVRKPQATTSGIVAFFAAHGIDREDREVFLPIRFVE